MKKRDSTAGMTGRCVGGGRRDGHVKVDGIVGIGEGGIESNSRDFDVCWHLTAQDSGP